MIEPGTGISIAGGLYVSKKVIDKILGPTAEYIGGQAKELVERANINLSTIFKKAEQKLGDKINTPGEVNPRVFMDIYQHGMLCDDPVTTEYFAGILASSRTEIRGQIRDKGSR